MRFWQLGRRFSDDLIEMTGSKDVTLVRPRSLSYSATLHASLFGPVPARRTPLQLRGWRCQPWCAPRPHSFWHQGASYDTAAAQPLRPSGHTPQPHIAADPSPSPPSCHLTLRRFLPCEKRTAPASPPQPRIARHTPTPACHSTSQHLQHTSTHRALAAMPQRHRSISRICTHTRQCGTSCCGLRTACWAHGSVHTGPTASPPASDGPVPPCRRHRRCLPLPQRTARRPAGLPATLAQPPTLPCPSTGTNTSTDTRTDRTSCRGAQGSRNSRVKVWYFLPHAWCTTRTACPWTAPHVPVGPATPAPPTPSHHQLCPLEYVFNSAHGHRNSSASARCPTPRRQQARWGSMTGGAV